MKQRLKQIGILGGGQLGMMLSESINRYGCAVTIFDPDPLAPACKQVASSFNNAWTDVKALEKFFAQVSVSTYEFENVDSAALFEFEKKTPLYPSAQVLHTTQNRFREKSFLKSHNLPHANFVRIDDLTKLPQLAKEIGYPCILKSSFGGYDGKGQYFLSSENDLQNAKSLGKQTPAYDGVLEEALDIEMEVSCIVARSSDQQEIVFPVFENIHKNHILDFTILPARVPPEVEAEVRRIALSAAKELDVIGLLTTEFFLTTKRKPGSSSIEVGDWQIYINEFAPRPHNSGHVTMAACTVSQFDALARVLLGIPLTQPEILADGAYCMGNLLGDVWLAQGGDDLDLSPLAQHPNVVDVVLYGKREARTGRKMGHFVTHGKNAAEALQAAKDFRSSLENLDKSFLERVGGPPKFLINSGNPDSSSRKSRKHAVDAHLQERAERRKSMPPEE